MDQIRSTMMQHEALFREQVQALHKLYNIQRLAMQEIRRRIYSQAQVLAFGSERVLLLDDQLQGSILEGKPLGPPSAAGRACKEESLALTLHPFLAFKVFKGSGSFWMKGIETSNFRADQKKPVRNFDLEKLPEDIMDEPEFHVGSNSAETVDMKSTISESTANTKEISSFEVIPSVSQVEYQSLKQMCSETDLRLCTQINQNSDRASEGKASESDINKCVAKSWSSKSTTEKHTLREGEQKYAPAEVNSDILQDINSSSNGHVVKPTSPHQGSSVFTTQLDPVKFKELHLERVADKGKGSSCLGSQEQHQDTTSPKSVQPNCCSDGDSSKENNDFFIQRSLHSERSSLLRDENMHLPALTFQTIMDRNNDNPKDSSNGSNSTLSQDATRCKNKNNAASAEDTLGLGDYSFEKGQMSHDGGGVVESKRQESPQFTQNGTKHSFCLNSEAETMSSLDKPIGTDSNEDATAKSAQHEGSESIAAEILLSFAPSRKSIDSEFLCTQTRGKSGKSSRDKDKNPTPHETRHANCGIDGSMKWTKSVSRRRSSRRPR